MKKIESATVWMGDKHDAQPVGDYMWLTIRIGDHEILINTHRAEVEEALEGLAIERESQLWLDQTRGK
jgi:hypothetical protein|tara:strand:+ start:361 stop:564 length:204 start_codon:yes stop_codon:yes gene_type:complete